MIECNCLRCGKKFKAKNYLVERGFGKYCSHDCYHKDSIGKIVIWNKGIKWIKKKRSGKTIQCLHCGKEKYFEPNQLKRSPCKYCSIICARKAKIKSCLTIYSSIHARIKVDFGRADVCEKCGSNKTVDWANISNKYLIERNDWKKLCRKCHIHFDKTKVLAI